MSVSKSLDGYVNQYGDKNPMWIVELSNGETIYQDDERPGKEPSSAWKRLKTYCEKNDVHIVNMKIKNRSNVQDIGSNHDGYFFCKSAGAFMFGDETIHSFIIGTLDEGRLRVRKWVTPEMSPDRLEERNPFANPECLITKKGVLNEELQTQDNGPAL